MRYSVLKTNFLNILFKIFYIIPIAKNNFGKEETEILTKLISNIFSFLYYFIENNEDNAILICSDYIMNGLLKLPDIYLLSIFTLYANCIDLILKNKGFICDPIPIVEKLYNHLINYKKNSSKIWKKEAIDFFIDDVKIIDQVIFLFINIIIKIFLQMKLLYPYSCEKYLKQMLLNFLENFEYSSLINYNSCLLLLLINKIFDSSDETDREVIIKFITLEKLSYDLEDTNIHIDLRTQILIFIYKFYLSLYFKRNDKPNEIISNNENKNKSKEKKKRIVQTKLQKKINSININILTVNINSLFRLNDEKPLKNNFYLNAIGQNQDVFISFKENALISNYQFPSKYLTFN
jgi:hypothetical protein